MNRSEIMKRAWNLYRSNKAVDSFAAALRKAWAEYKEAHKPVEAKAQVKDWFFGTLASELNLGRVAYIVPFAFCKESEKAMYVIFNTGSDSTGKARRRAHWIPKSAIENIELVKKFSSYEEAVDAFEAELN